MNFKDLEISLRESTFNKYSGKIVDSILRAEIESQIKNQLLDLYNKGFLSRKPGKVIASGFSVITISVDGVLLYDWLKEFYQQNKITDIEYKCSMSV